MGFIIDNIVASILDVGVKESVTEIELYFFIFYAFDETIHLIIDLDHFPA